MFINVLLFFKGKPLTSCIDDKMHISGCRCCPHVQSTKTKAEENVSVHDVTFNIVTHVRSNESTDKFTAANDCHDQCGLSRVNSLTVHLLYLQMKKTKELWKKSLYIVLWFSGIQWTLWFSFIFKSLNNLYNLEFQIMFLSYNETVLLSIIL